MKKVDEAELARRMPPDRSPQSGTSALKKTAVIPGNVADQ